MNNIDYKECEVFSPSPSHTRFKIELNKVPIEWDLENGSFTFFGLDSALFWTDPSLVRVFAPLADEVGRDLFRLLVAHSSSLGTKEDYHSIIASLGDDFAEGFLAWGKAVSMAGWGVFEMPTYDPVAKIATVIVRNPFELKIQRNLLPEKRWGCPSLQGKIIGIFSHAFNEHCWADDICYYDADTPYVVYQIYGSKKTISEELIKLRKERMLSRERALTREVERKTEELRRSRKALEDYSRTLEEKVTARTSELETILGVLEAEKEKFKFLAETDSLTGLYNRRAFFGLSEEILKKYSELDRPVTVIMLDVDSFKRINDVYGHSVGDQVLVVLSGLIKKMFRTSDVIGRIGGEEFAILCPNSDFVKDRAPLENLRKAIEEFQISAEGHKIKVTVSIGATTGKKTDNLGALIKQADRMLYRAKESGRNCIVSS
jgi:diguanylate cyclase (GGDEF)-like protein